MKKNIDEIVYSCQPVQNIEHLEIIEIDGIRLAVEYNVSIHDIDTDRGIIDLVIGIDDVCFSRVH